MAKAGIMAAPNSPTASLFGFNYPFGAQQLTKCSHFSEYRATLELLAFFLVTPLSIRVCPCFPFSNKFFSVSEPICLPKTKNHITAASHVHCARPCTESDAQIGAQYESMARPLTLHTLCVEFVWYRLLFRLSFKCVRIRIRMVSLSWQMNDSVYVS